MYDTVYAIAEYYYKKPEKYAFNIYAPALSWQIYIFLNDYENYSLNDISQSIPEYIDSILSAPTKPDIFTMKKEKLKKKGKGLFAQISESVENVANTMLFSSEYVTGDAFLSTDSIYTLRSRLFDDPLGLDLIYHPGLYNIEYLGEKKVYNKNTYVLRMYPKNEKLKNKFNIYYFFDPKTYLLVARTDSSRVIPVSMYNFEYKTKDGIRYPYKWQEKRFDKVTIEINKARFNIPLSDTLFYPPLYAKH